MTDEYTPFRIMKSFVVPGPNQAYLRANFPSGSINQVGKNRQWQSIYRFKQVVNSPTPSESAFFLSSGYGRLIPQDPGGFDRRDSGIARSIKSSVDARQEHRITMGRRKFAEEEAAVRKKNAELAMEQKEPKLELEPEQESLPEIYVCNECGKTFDFDHEEKFHLNREPGSDCCGHITKRPLPDIETNTDGVVKEEREAEPETTTEPEEVTALEPETEPKKTSRGRRKRKKSDEES